MVRQRDERLEQLKREMKPLMKRANQRLLRLEQASLHTSHGYNAAKQVTGKEQPRFTTRGKSYEQLQDDKQRIQNFLDYQSSTVTGAKQQLQRYAQQMRMPGYDNHQQLTEHASKFFQLSKYVQQYIRNTSQERHISSDEVFMGISRAVDAGDVDLSNINFDNFDVTANQMIAIVQHAGGQRSNNLFDDLNNMNNVQYSRSRRVQNFNPDDF